MKKVTSRVVNIVFTVLVLLSVAIFVSVSYNAKRGKVTSVFGYSFMAVQTGSMTPEYPIGCVIIAKRCEPSKLAVGDVISFYSLDPEIVGKVVTHRIVEIKKNSNSKYFFVTKGDANVLEDKYIADGENIIGKVVKKSTVFEKLVKLRRNPKLFFLLVIIPICAIIVYEFVGVSKQINSKDESKNKDGKTKEGS